MGSSIMTLALFALASNIASAQDIFERARERSRSPSMDSSTYIGRDRIDLQMSADLRSASFNQDRGTGRVGVGATLDFDFACGKFDVGASLRSLFSKNAREEYLGAIMGYIESELVRNALVLACEASPTICQALQHYRVTANAMLGMNYNRCQAIEQAVSDSLAKQRAEAIKACVDEKQRAGVPMDQALDQCQNSDKVRSLTGERVKEIDLIDELKKALNLSQEETASLTSLLGNRVKYTGQGGSGEIARDAVEQEYRRARDRYVEAWQSTVDAAARGNQVQAQTLAALVPPGSPPISPTELAELALLRPALRSVVIASIASQCAILELMRRAHEVERNIEAARKLPTANEELIKKLERERADLRAEIVRLTETHARQNDLNRTLLEATAVARNNVAFNAAAAMTQPLLDERRIRVQEETQKWGGGTVNTQPGRSNTRGPGCGDCGPTTWSFGNVSNR